MEASEACREGHPVPHCPSSPCPHADPQPNSRGPRQAQGLRSSLTWSSWEGVRGRLPRVLLARHIRLPKVTLQQS